jgi:ABC-type lipoprotein release transport system permease subunit
MLFKLAWRNIWRNKRKSLIVLGSIVVGMIAVIFYDGLDHGMLRQMLNNQISSSVAHIQIHKEGFNNNKVIKNFIPDNQIVEKVVKNQKDIKAYSERVITFGLLSSATSSSGVYIYGIYPEMEAKVSNIKSSIIQGNFLSEGKRDIVIGKKLAEKLGVGIGDKLVLMANTPEGNIGSDLFRVSGIFQTVNSEFDKSTIYVPVKTVQQMLNIDNHIYEYAIILNDYRNADKVKAELESKLNSSYEVLSYKDLLPMLIYQMELYDESMWIFYMIVGLALIFGIVNTMLMSVFERTNEIGVLMAIGMKNSKIFLMFVFEAFMLGLIGTIAGLICGLLIHWPISISGINFSIFSDALKSFGIGAVIYPVLSVSNTIVLTIIIPFIAVIGALYPAYRAIKLEPIKAIYYV